jgi:phospholipase C
LIDHFIVIYQENWSFDGLYGSFPGANGLQDAATAGTVAQVDRFGNPMTSLPDPSTDPHVPGGLPVGPYDLSQYVAPAEKTNDIVHRFYTEQLQIDNGALDTSNGHMDKFVAYSDNGSLVQSFFDATNLPEGLLAQQYTMDDNFFHAAYGGSFLNHQFLVAAAPPQWNQPIPAGFQSSYDPVTKQLVDANLTIDGQYDVNTTYAAQAPHPSTVAAEKLLQPINDIDPSQPGYTPTIGDRLDAAGISWRWYSGGWNDALAGHADSLFQYHHQPFAYYARYAPFNADGSLNPATTGPDAHLQDETQFFADLNGGVLPGVTFIKPLGPDNEHPGYTSLLQGQQHVADIVHAVQNRPEWPHTAIIITYDEHGGRWDHVTPPTRDEWGDGTRVPAIVISPYANRGAVDHTQHDTLSILKTIEERFGLQPLNERDANASDLTSSLVRTPNADIARAYLQPDFDHPGQSALIVGGTEISDVIQVSTDGGVIQVSIDSSSFHLSQSFDLSSVSRLEVYAQGGNDTVTVTLPAALQAFVFGGSGNDRIEVDGGPSVLVGGAGSDTLIGGSTASILIGSQGADHLRAGSAGDLLIAGPTSFDANLKALKGLSAEWSSAGTYQERIDALTGAAAGGLNGSYVLSSSTLSDDNSPDDLKGGLGRDWYFALLSGDRKDTILALGADELVSSL